MQCFKSLPLHTYMLSVRLLHRGTGRIRPDVVFGCQQHMPAEVWPGRDATNLQTRLMPNMMCVCTRAQDGVAMLWDLAEGKRLYSLDAGDIIHALTFSPNRYWLCAATQVRRRRCCCICCCRLGQ